MTTLDQLLAFGGRTRADLQLQRGGELSNLLRREGVLDSSDLQRVKALPRCEDATPELIDLLSAALRLRTHDDQGRENKLRGPQAMLLRELFEVGGAFAPMRVGSGKTLPTMLAPTLLDAEHPGLVLPAAMFKGSKKTQREFAEYRQNWRVRLPRLISYEELGRKTREHALLQMAPDLLMLDEGHKAKNLDAACTRRIGRCIEWLHPKVLILSGTLMTDSLLEYHHLALWALGDRAPVPLRPVDAETWARALDRDAGTMRRIELGALEQLPGGFHEHFRGSRGVVPTPGSDCDASIEISTWKPDTPPALAKVIYETEIAGMRPDGELLDEMELPECLSQLALGFYYRWDPMPPDWWLDPRRAWYTYVRAVLDEHLPGYDSPSQIVSALDGLQRAPAVGSWVDTLETKHQQILTSEVGLPPAHAEGRQLLAGWRAVRDEFTPNPVPEWIDRGIIAQAIQRAGAGCLIWTRFRAAGHELHAQGVPYYGGGTDPQAALGSPTLALSIASHATGRNLQAWSRALVLTPMGDPNAWEQLIGRVHRAGQQADLVEVGIIESIDYHTRLLTRVRARAIATSKATGFSQKLVDATWLD